VGEDGGPRAPRRPTLRDVAGRAGVSIKTVSRVVNGEPGVAAVVADRVRAAVAEVGYVPDAFASNLRRGDRRTRAIALVVEDVANPFSAALHRAVADTAHAEGVVTLAASHDRDPDRERDAVLAFAGRRVDGVVLMPSVSAHAWLDGLRAAGMEVVLVDRPAEGLTADVVLSDHRAGAERAVAHLVAHGHRRIAFLADEPGIFSAAERLAGYRAALGAAGERVDEQLVRTGLRDAAAAERAAVDLLGGTTPPTALLTGQNLLTEGAVRGLRRLGRQREVALVGFDDVPLGDLLDPGVTVVAQSPAQLGATAARRLLQRIAGDRTPAATAVLPTELIARGSGEIPGPSGP
jgi:LacI family transcriptional regulator